MKRHRRISRRPSALIASLLSTSAVVAGSGGLLTAARAQVPAPPAAPAQAVPTQSVAAPVALWNLDEGTGTTAADSSGRGNNGTLGGGVSWADGLVGAHALRFTAGGSGSVETEKPVVDTSRSYTVTAWVKFAQIGGYQTLVSIDGNQVSGFFLQLRGTTNTLGMVALPADDAATNMPVIAAASASPEAGQWYHVAGVYDSAAQTLALYINGGLQQTVPFTTPWRATGHTAIGRGRFDSHPVDYASADIDEVRFYDTALGAPDIAALAKEALPAPTLTIDTAAPTGKVSPMLYGLMTEEINYAYDGGIYGELLRNRNLFPTTRTTNGVGGLVPTPGGEMDWRLTVGDGGSGAVAYDTSAPVNTTLPHSLRLTATQASVSARVGIVNEGYWGIPVKPATRYRATFYARAVSPAFKGPLTVTLEGETPAIVFAKASVGKITDRWQKYEVTLRTDSKISLTKGSFVIAANGPGVVDFSLVSLFPPTYKDRPNGNRVDLMQKLAEMKPAFLRLPGGNYLEGNTIAERFDWKRTLGPIEVRPGHQGPWGYRSTDGMGLLEFLQWCEDLRMEPVLAVYAGYSLNGEHAAPGTPLQPFVQDALDEIEYVTGDRKTIWGARRAADGHPAPFPLRYVEIGNEDWLDKSGSYDGRFAQFYDAIKARYPNLQLIATTKTQARVPDVIDDHYYLLPDAMGRTSHKYDNYSRTGPKIFVGEWATQAIDRPWEHPAMSGGPTPDWKATLGDAAFLTGMERNSDLIVMECYAPLLVNVNANARQWSQNLIGYDALSSYGSPSYYTQVLFATHVGDTIVPAKLAGVSGLFTSVTQDSAKGTVYVKIVNTSSSSQPVKIDITGTKTVAANQDATVYTLAAPSLSDTNSLRQPNQIAPVTSTVLGAGPSFSYTFAPYSVTVLVLGK